MNNPTPMTKSMRKCSKRTPRNWPKRSVSCRTSRLGTRWPTLWPVSGNEDSSSTRGMSSAAGLTTRLLCRNCPSSSTPSMITSIWSTEIKREDSWPRRKHLGTCATFSTARSLPRTRRTRSWRKIINSSKEGSRTQRRLRWWRRLRSASRRAICLIWACPPRGT